MFKNILLTIFSIIWLALAFWGVIVVNKAFKKYKKYKQTAPTDPKYAALVRDDYQNWDKQKTIIGCFTLFPFRFIMYASVIFGCLVFAVLIKIFGQRSIINFIFINYLNTYGKFVTRIMCTVKQQFQNKQIVNPIIITNHVNWFDIYFLIMGYAPLSFVAKEDVKHYPLVGVLAQTIQCIFVNRDSEKARNQAKYAIKKRIQQRNRKVKNKFPLVIYPEGTTSNGKGLLSFKGGAFEYKSKITALCLRYQCKKQIDSGENFEVGLDQITQGEHVVFMMSLLTTLRVKRIDFEPINQETADQYNKRCQSKMAQVLGIFCTEGGYRDKVQLEKYRKQKGL